jgi:predicted ATPase
MANTDHRVIVETHSEHLLLRVRRLIASKKIDAKKVAIYFVEKSGKLSAVPPLPLEADGHIPNDAWPEGFFGEPLQEALGLAAAQAQYDRPHTKRRGKAQ